MPVTCCAKNDFSALFSDLNLNSRDAVLSRTRAYTIADIKCLAHLLACRIKKLAVIADEKNEIIVACNSRLAVAAAFASGALGYHLVFPNSLLPLSIENACSERSACLLLDDCDLKDNLRYAISWSDVVADYERMTESEAQIATEEISSAWKRFDRRSMLISQCTSGSTGKPKRITRNLLLCEGEASASVLAFGEGADGEIVASTAPLIHSYGLFQTFLFPLLRGHCVCDEMITGMSMLAETASRTEKFIFAATPAFLKRIDPEVRIRGCSRIISSGGVLSPKALNNAQTVFGLDSVTEIYGCTEIGAIAFRESFRGDEPAIPLAGNKVAVLRAGEIFEDGTGLICLYSSYASKSPFIGDDVINVRTDGRFEVIGRSGRIVKIEDVRISLDEIENALREDSKIADVAVIVYRRGERLYVGAAAVLDNKAMAYRETCGHGMFFKEIRSCLRGKIIDLAMPRKIIIAEEIPHLANGKTDYQAVCRMFSEPGSDNP